MLMVTTDTPRADALTIRREELLTVKEFAYLLKEHPHSVYRRIRERRQPGVVRSGREVRIDVHQALTAA